MQTLQFKSYEYESLDLIEILNYILFAIVFLELQCILQDNDLKVQGKDRVLLQHLLNPTNGKKRLEKVRLVNKQDEAHT